ncbi:hypothetical protein D3C76_1710210 [compost metagenome]
MCGPAAAGTADPCTDAAVAAKTYAIDVAHPEQTERPGQTGQADAAYLGQLRAAAGREQSLGSEAGGLCA